MKVDLICMQEPSAFLPTEVLNQKTSSRREVWAKTLNLNYLDFSISNYSSYATHLKFPSIEICQILKRSCLSMCLSVFNCISVFLSVVLFVCLSFCLSVFLGVCLLVCRLLVCMSSCLSVFISVCISFCLYFFLDLSLSVFLLDCLSLWVFDCLSVLMFFLFDGLIIWHKYNRLGYCTNLNSLRLSNTLFKSIFLSIFAHIIIDNKR